MTPDYWLKRWQENRIGFHQSEVHPRLVQYFSRLNLKPQDRIFVPLCGKSHDIAWLLAQELQVVGCELSPLAVAQLFDTLHLSPEITLITHDVKLYQSEQIFIFVGDIFHLQQRHLGHIDAVYDRAALVALPPNIRPRYTQHLQILTQCARQLLITFTYEQAQMSGPPFSVPATEIATLYQQNYQITPLDHTDMPQFKQTCFATEDVSLLMPK